ncbi:MAG TPA: thiamine phosphate synthase [Bryobacteraceae bacterium]|nr:thiamine phosphate synthase [Bryobacteraceae bacterium]
MTLPRFYPILDTAVIERCRLNLVDAAEALLNAGARIIQLRHKAHFHRDLYACATRIAELCASARATFVINDRADIAMLLDAAVHVGQDDLPPADVRRIGGPNRTLGFSTHNEAQLRAAAAEPIDYVALGPIFGTQSKFNPDPEVGLEELRRLKPLAQAPLVAIGGIDRTKAASVWAAGADSIAVVGDLYPDVRRSAEDWMKLAHE